MVLCLLSLKCCCHFSIVVSLVRGLRSEDQHPTSDLCGSLLQRFG